MKSIYLREGGREIEGEKREFETEKFLKRKRERERERRREIDRQLTRES
jgi:hypothetical protein